MIMEAKKKKKYKMRYSTSFSRPFHGITQNDTRKRNNLKD